MKTAIVLEQSDIKALIAKEYNVNEKAVIKTQYSYIVLTSSTAEESEAEE